MGRAGSSWLAWTALCFLALSGLATGHLYKFVNVCPAEEKMVQCAPVCPRICVTLLLPRVCRGALCKPGCVCRKGRVRRGVINGICIPRDECTRWII